MGLAADSTFADVVLDTIAEYVPTDTDLESWVELDPATGDDIVTTTTGLFGGSDLTTFNENCAVASDNCDVADYEKYSGWAIGIKWTAADAARLRQATDEECSTVIFADSSRLVELYWSTTNEIWNGDVDGDITADAPTNTGDVAWEDNPSTSPFDGNWFGEVLGLADQEQYAITFQEEGADVYYEVGDTATLWVHKDFADGVDTEVTWAGAAQLTAAASVIVASLLF